MSKRARVALFILFLMPALSCGPFGGGGRVGEPGVTPEVTDTSPAIDPIGIVSRQTDIVEHGAGVEQLARLLDTADLRNEDAVRVTGGGEALLDFGDSLKLILFNDSQLSVSSRPVEDGAPLAQFYLWWGGFLGEKVPEQGGEVVVETPNGATITVTGTQFFVIYDPGLETSAVGNFDGSVQVEAGTHVTTLSPGRFMVVEGTQSDGGQIISAQQPITFSPEEFMRASRSLRSAPAAATALAATPTVTPSPTPTLAPQRAIAVFTLEANCRVGPGVLWEVETVYGAGTESLVVGRTADSSWWLLAPDGERCWAAASVLDVRNGQLVPIVATPIPPTVTPTLTPTPTFTPTPSPSPTPTPFPPQAPVGLDTSSICGPPYDVQLYWTDQANNEDGYRVYRRLWDYETDQYGDWEVLANTLAPDTNNYLDSPGPSGQAIYWIGAYNQAGVGWSSVEKYVCVE